MPPITLLADTAGDLGELGDSYAVVSWNATYTGEFREGYEIGLEGYERLVGDANSLVDALLVRHVHSHGDRVATAPVDIRGDALCALTVEVSNDDALGIRPEEAGCRLADARRRAGDPDDPIAKSHA